MTPHYLTRMKQDYRDNYTVADQPMDITMSASLNRKHLDAIQDNERGYIVPISEMVDNYDKVEESIKKKLAFNYSLDDASKFPFNFLMLDGSVSDIQSPDNSGGMVLGGSLALPAVSGGTLPTDDVSPCGNYKKVLDHDAPIHYVLGEPHSFSHALKHSNVGSSYPLITRQSKLNQPMLFPTGQIRGTGGVSPTRYNDLIRKSLLYGHDIRNDTVYPDAKYNTVTETMNVHGMTGGVTSSNLVGIPHSAWPASWYTERPSYRNDNGMVVPLDEYASSMYEFIDQYNSSRPTNFNNAGIWWNGEMIKNVPKIKAKLSFRVAPIVPANGDGKELIPYNNFLKHLSASLRRTDKPLE